MAVTTGDELCRECEASLEHCHAIAIVHFDGTVECMDDPDCRRSAPAHLVVLICDDEECRTS